MSSAAALAAGLALLPVVLAAQLQRTDLEPAADTSIVEMLRRLAERGVPYTDSSVIAAKLERQVTETTDLKQKVGLTFKLGDELLNAGESEKAIAVFQEIRRFFAQPNVDPHPQLQRQLGEKLAVAYLRLAEQDNCLGLHNRSSCIVPVAPEAKHENERGSRGALEELSKLLAEEKDLGYRWLYNLAAMNLGLYPDGVPSDIRVPPELFSGESDLTAFYDIAPDTGTDIVGTSGGAIIEDFDGDGRLDIMASAWGLTEQLRLLRNRGDGGFEDITAAAGLVGEVGGLNLAHADYDNDGDADVLVLRGAWLSAVGRHPNSLLRNDGAGHFVDVTREAAVLSFNPTQVGVWADYDNDGWLDLFVGNESDRVSQHPAELFRNQGDGTFRNVAAEVGLDIVGLIKGAAWGDADNDGDPDLYVSRFDQPNLLFVNERSGNDIRFVEAAAERGVDQPLKSFPTWFWDFDNDGDEDLVAATFMGFGASSLGVATADLLGYDVPAETARLYRNLGEGRFEDVSAAAGLDVLLVAMGANYGDLDGDGFLDAYFGTGEPDLMTLIPNRMFRNRGDGRFEDVTFTGGFGHLQKGHGIAFGDLDNDGDEDLYAVMGGARSGDVYQNVLFENPGNDNRWITLVLEGTEANRSAVGARLAVRLETPRGSRVVHRTAGTGGSFGSSSLQQEIGIGDALSIPAVEITWPSPGYPRQTWDDLEPGGAYRLRQGEKRAVKLERLRIRLGGAEKAVPATGHHDHQAAGEP